MFPNVWLVVYIVHLLDVSDVGFKTSHAGNSASRTMMRLLKSDVAYVLLKFLQLFVLSVINVHPQCGVFLRLGLCRTWCGATCGRCCPRALPLPSCGLLCLSLYATASSTGLFISAPSSTSIWSCNSWCTQRHKHCKRALRQSALRGQRTLLTQQSGFHSLPRNGIISSHFMF